MRLSSDVFITELVCKIRALAFACSQNAPLFIFALFGHSFLLFNEKHLIWYSDYSTYQMLLHSSFFKWNRLFPSRHQTSSVWLAAYSQPRGRMCNYHHCWFPVFCLLLCWNMPLLLQASNFSQMGTVLFIKTSCYALLPSCLWRGYDHTRWLIIQGNFYLLRWPLAQRLCTDNRWYFHIWFQNCQKRLNYQVFSG